MMSILELTQKSIEFSTFFKATGNDKPPSYDKVVVTEETDTKA